MRILLLEGDIDAGQVVTDHLEALGHTVDWMKLCSQATAAIQRTDHDLLLMELSLPDGDALSHLNAWRASLPNYCGVIVTTSRSDVRDRVQTLTCGADDFLVKPFHLDELAARIHALARRLNPQASANAPLVLDARNKVARVDRQIIDLTSTEWTLLSCLASQPGHTLSRDQLKAELARVGRGGESESNSMEVIISRLRRKIGFHAITTRRGLGYRLERAASTGLSSYTPQAA